MNRYDFYFIFFFILNLFILSMAFKNKRLMAYNLINTHSLIVFLNNLKMCKYQFLLILLYFSYLALFVPFLKIQSFL